MKLKRLKGNVAECADRTDGYRGESRLEWRFTGKYAHDLPIEEFAIKCRCGAWWGWTHIQKAEKLLKRLEKKGCPKCKKQS